jgi:carboxyl-terminal processing protease
MSTKLKWIGVVLLVTALLAAQKPAEKYFEIAKNLDIFATLFKEVNAYYVDEINAKHLIDKGIEGMLESLDPYTIYIPEEQIENFRISTTGQYGGIGALIGIVNDKTVITHPYKNFPAYNAGIRVGDQLVEIDGQQVGKKETSDVSLLLKGQPKTEVSIKLRRPGQKEDIFVKVKREKISVGNVTYFAILEPGIGYIQLEDFTPGASKEVASAILELKEKGATKLILDLRDNPGGLLHEAVNIVSLLIPKSSEVVSTKGKVKEWNKTFTTLNNPIDTQIPLTILINENSASASEIVAGALQDYDRAVLIGRKTFGKGLVQTTRSLSYNAQLKVTTAKYYIPSGRCIQAIDYEHRNKDGVVEKFPDSLKKEFATKAGRKIYDGGGLDPDVITPQNYLGSITASLLQNGFIFEYATLFRNQNPAPLAIKDFALKDQQYDDFIAWVRARDFQYTTGVEKSSLELFNSAKEERYFKELEPYIEGLKKQIEFNKSTDLLRYKSEIKQLLEQQIAFHYFLTEGQAALSLKKDESVNQAIEILNTITQYKQLLSPL